MTFDERQLLQNTSDRLLRAAAAMERIAKQLEDSDIRDITVMHEIRTQLASIRAALGVEEKVREAIREATGSHKVPREKTDPRLTALGMILSQPAWLKVLIIMLAFAVVFVCGGAAAKAWLH